MRVLVPGRRGILIFLATALAGLTVWAISTPVLAYLLLGERAYVASYSARSSSSTVFPSKLSWL